MILVKAVSPRRLPTATDTKNRIADTFSNSGEEGT